MIIPFLYVGLGGFIGAVLRFGASLATAGWSVALPFGTLVSNVLGCFVIGVVAAMAAATDAVSPNARLFLATGICGGFTTMSSFVYELAEYLRSSDYLMGALYFGVTIFGSVLMFYLGTILVSLARA
jgi:CrcB protein